MRLTVIVADANHAVHIGGEVERHTRTFDAPAEIADYIDRWKANGGYVSVCIAIEDQGETT